MGNTKIASENISHQFRCLSDHFVVITAIFTRDFSFTLSYRFYYYCQLPFTLEKEKSLKFATKSLPIDVASVVSDSSRSHQIFMPKKKFHFSSVKNIFLNGIFSLAIFLVLKTNENFHFCFFFWSHVSIIRKPPSLRTFHLCLAQKFAFEWAEKNFLFCVCRSQSSDYFALFRWRSVPSTNFQLEMFQFSFFRMLLI